jgi:hypothetical protein
MHAAPLRLQDEEAILVERVLSWFRSLQPAEKKMVLDRLTDMLYECGFVCTYCGRRTRDVVWLRNLPICERCHSWLFSPKTKIRTVYGVRR